MKERDLSIDILRAMAIIGIIIAHSNPSYLFIQLRSFDVVLMVFLSATCARGGVEKENFNYLDFIIKRAYRLIIPVWIFLIVYYAGVYMLYYLPPYSELLASFLFISDRYVWIIRILIILAVCAPFINKWTNKIGSFYILAICASVLYLCEFIFNKGLPHIAEIILMTIPYAVVYIIGININRYNTKLITLIILLLIAGLSLNITLNLHNGHSIDLSKFKYPPHFMYIAYGLGVSLFLWIYRKDILIFLRHIKLDIPLLFIGQNTYWMYLLHIPFVDFAEDKYDSVIRFFIIFTGAVISVIIKNLITKRINNYRLATIFKG